MYAMNIQNDVIGFVLCENCNSKQVTDFIAWPSRCHDTIQCTWYWLIRGIISDSHWFCDVNTLSQTITLRDYLDSPSDFCVIRVAYLFSFLLCFVFVCFDCHRPVSCVPNVASVCWLSSSCVLCTQCCQCMLIVIVLCLVYPMLPVSLVCLFLLAPSVFSNIYFHPVSCVSYVASFSGFSISACPFDIL